MKKHKQLTQIRQKSLSRRLAVSIAGAQGGVRLLGSHLSSVLLPDEKKVIARQESITKEARLFAQTLGELKGTYVKAGQILALYGDHFLPPQISAALHDLEHNTPSLAWEVIEPVLQEPLGNKFNNLEINEKPLAAASLAQVHRAQMKESGQELVLKVQYPGVAKTIDADFDAVLTLLRLARWSRNVRNFEAWTEEIRSMLHDEVDYHRESSMTERVAQLLGNDPRYIVPRINHEYSHATLITMDYIEGVEVNHANVAKLSLARRNALAMSMLELFFKEIFEWGLMQTDPNFGNYRVQIADKKKTTDRLVLLDFGAVRELEAGFLKALQTIIIAAYQNDRSAVERGALGLGCITAEQCPKVKGSFIDFCILLMEPFRKEKNAIPTSALNNKQHYRWNESKLLKRAGKVAAQSVSIEGFSSPPKEFALIARKLSGVFSFVASLRAELDAHSIIEKYIDQNEC